MPTDNPTHAELVEAVRIADAFIKAQASRLESQASRIEELEAELRYNDTLFIEWLRAWSKKRFGKWITHNTARGALNDLRAALKAAREQQ